MKYLKQSYFRYNEIDLNFATSLFYPLVQHRIFGVSDFLGSCGGLMGLIAGISVISIVECCFLFISIFFTNETVKINPSFEGLPSPRPFLVNHDHIFYHFAKFFTEFMSKSSIHGLHSATDKKSSKMNKLFWLIVVAVSSVFCSWAIFDSVRHAELNPIVIGVDENFWKIEDVSTKKSKRHLFKNFNIKTKCQCAGICCKN